MYNEKFLTIGKITGKVVNVVKKTTSDINNAVIQPTGNGIIDAGNIINNEVIQPTGNGIIDAANITGNFIVDTANKIKNFAVDMFNKIMDFFDNISNDLGEILSLSCCMLLLICCLYFTIPLLPSMARILF